MNPSLSLSEKAMAASGKPIPNHAHASYPGVLSCACCWQLEQLKVYKGGHGVSKH